MTDRHSVMYQPFTWTSSNSVLSPSISPITPILAYISNIFLFRKLSSSSKSFIKNYFHIFVITIAVVIALSLNKMLFHKTFLVYTIFQTDKKNQSIRVEVVIRMLQSLSDDPANSYSLLLTFGVVPEAPSLVVSWIAQKCLKPQALGHLDINFVKEE